jgi:hypothetical protein
LLRRVLGWEPRISLEEGLAVTYAWIAQELDNAGPPAQKEKSPGRALNELTLSAAPCSNFFHRERTMRILILRNQLLPGTYVRLALHDRPERTPGGAGHTVRVVTAFPYYPEWRILERIPGTDSRKLETRRGVEIRRVLHFIPWRASSLVQRLVHDFSFTLAALIAGLAAGECDVIYCSCPPPALALAAFARSAESEMFPTRSS